MAEINDIKLSGKYGDWEIECVVGNTNLPESSQTFRAKKDGVDMSHSSLVALVEAIKKYESSHKKFVRQKFLKIGEAPAGFMSGTITSITHDYNPYHKIEEPHAWVAWDGNSITRKTKERLCDLVHDTPENRAKAIEMRDKRKGIGKLRDEIHDIEASLEPFKPQDFEP